MKTLKIVDVFAGIGMFSLGGHWAGFETLAFIEWDNYCQKVLRKNFPETKIYGDVNEVDGKQWRGAADIVCGGFPCQPYSIGGNRKGKADDRDEWDNLFRICKEARPGYFIGENVANILNMEPERFLNDLASINYRATVFNFPAYALGLQTLERHVWFIATPNEKRQQGKCKEEVSRIATLEREFSGSDTRIIRGRDISNTRFCRVGERNTRRMDKAGRERLKQIGNSIPPQAAYVLFDAIRRTEEQFYND